MVVAELVGNPRRPSVQFLVRRASTSLARCAPSAFVGDLPRFQRKAAVSGALCGATSHFSSMLAAHPFPLNRPCQARRHCVPCPQSSSVSVGICLAGQGCARNGTAP